MWIIVCALVRKIFWTDQRDMLIEGTENTFLKGHDDGWTAIQWVCTTLHP